MHGSVWFWVETDAAWLQKPQSARRSLLQSELHCKTALLPGTEKQLCSQGCIPIEPKLYHFSVQGVQSLGPAQRHREPCGRVVRCSPGTLHKAPAPLALCTRHPTTWPAECSPHLFNMSSAMPLSTFASTCMACGKEECPSLLSYCSLQR